MKQVRSFFGHAGFYRRFIKDFSEVPCPLSNSFSKDSPFEFDESCRDAFEKFRSLLVSVSIIQPLDFLCPFEIVCDVPNFVVGAILVKG